jgi:hypothetical protein
MERTKISDDDFFLGLLHSLRLYSGQTAFGYSDRLWSSCCYAAYQLLEQEAPAAGIEIGFYLRLHPIHGDSQVAINGLQTHQGMAPLEAPRFDGFNLRIWESDARRELAAKPGSEELWQRVAEAFMSAYNSIALHA